MKMKYMLSCRLGFQNCCICVTIFIQNSMPTENEVLEVRCKYYILSWHNNRLRPLCQTKLTGLLEQKLSPLLFTNIAAILVLLKWQLLMGISIHEEYTLEPNVYINTLLLVYLNQKDVFPLQYRGMCFYSISMQLGWCKPLRVVV